MLTIFKMGQSWPLLDYFHSLNKTFLQKFVDFTGIRTRIYRLEGEHADDVTTATASPMLTIFSIRD